MNSAVYIKTTVPGTFKKRSKTNAIVAIRALAHKLARASYYVMRDQVDFDPDKAFA